MSDFTYSYDLPADCLKVRRLSDDLVNVKYRVEGRRIVCDESSITVLYTFRETDTTKYDALFVEALVALLAWKISYPIRKDLAVQKEKEAIYRSALMAAKNANAQEGVPDEPQCDDLLSVR